MDLTDLVEEDQSIIRKVAEARGISPRELWRRLRQQQAARFSAAAALREQEELRSKWEREEKQTVTLGKRFFS